MADVLVFDGAEAAEHGDEEGLTAALQALAPGVAARPTFARARDMAITGALMRALRCAWEGGWQPADIVRAAGKRLGRATTAVAAEVIVAEARGSAGADVAVPEPWADQLRHMAVAPGIELLWSDPDRLRVGIQLLGMLTHLPVLPCLLPPPSRWGHGRPLHVTMPAPGSGDTKMLAKVRALLAKAESTTFEEEANSLTAKAQELMARYAIDQAMISGTEAGPAGEGPGGRRIGIEDPYARGRSGLLAHVAQANRCRTVSMEGYGFSTIFGFPGDLDIVEVLYTSLLVQATRAMTAAGSVRDSLGRSRTRSFRLSFFHSFAGRIGERLGAATSQATEDAGAVHGAALLPVLAGRSAAVEDAFNAAFPNLVSVRARVSNYDGWVAGRVAADRAHLGPDQELPGVAV